MIRMPNQKRRRSPSAVDSPPPKKKMRTDVGEQTLSQGLGKPHTTTMDAQSPSDKPSSSPASRTVRSSPPTSSENSPTISVQGETVKTLLPFTAAYPTFLRDEGEPLEFFLDRTRKRCEQLPTHYWRVGSDLDAVPSDQVARLRSAVEQQVELHLRDSDSEPDTDDEREGRYDHKIASMPRGKRRSLLKARILQLGNEHGITRGKWVIFFKRQTTFLDMYERVAREHEQGRLGIAIEARYAEQGRVLFVWTKNVNDVEDVRAAAVALRRLGIDFLIRYKPEVFSLLKLRSKNDWGVKVIQYTSKELLPTLP